LLTFLSLIPTEEYRLRVFKYAELGRTCLIGSRDEEITRLEETA
jgi:hypothetical protein